MYREKVQEFVNNFITYKEIFIIDTMCVDYDLESNSGDAKVNLVSIGGYDKEKLFTFLNGLKDCVVIFDRIDMWCFDYKSQEYYDIFSDLSDFSKKNDLLIYT